jgi:hypothetical protein
MSARFSAQATAILVGLSLGVISLAAASSSRAQSASAPAAGYQITGFRSAKFGMTPADVRAAIAKDFGEVTVQANANPAEGTSALQVDVARLDPGPGPAQITYIFGARSRNLAHINVVWVTRPDPTADERAAMLTAAVQLAHYFQTLPAPLKASLGPRRTGPNNLLLFAGVDETGAGVEVAVDGVRYEISGPAAGATTSSLDPTGPALLRVSYIRDVAHPDILKIAPGAF